MNLTLNRYYSDTRATLGILCIEGKEDPVFHTVEKPWLDNEPFKSCIPSGDYIAKPYHSKKFSHYPDVWELFGDHRREKILIHVANKPSELQGCIAPGLSAGYMRSNEGMEKAVTNSALAMNSLKEITSYPSEFKLKIIG